MFNYLLVNLIVYFSIALLMYGVLNWLRERLLGKRGPGVLQPVRDLVALMGFRRSRTPNAHWITTFVPSVTVATYLTLGLLIPSVYLVVPEQGASHSVTTSGNLIVIMLVLVTPLLLLAWAAFASGSTFAQMGTTRALSTHVLIEPLAILIMVGFAILWGTPDLGSAFQEQIASHTSSLEMASAWLLLAAWFYLILAEIGTYPFDQFQNNLELIRGEEPVLIEFSGPDLALAKLGEMLRVAFYFTLMVHIAWPLTLLTPPANETAVVTSMSLYVGKLLIALVVLAPWELSRAQMSRAKLAAPIRMALLLTLIAIVIEMI